MRPTYLFRGHGESIGTRRSTYASQRPLIEIMHYHTLPSGNERIRPLPPISFTLSSSVLIFSDHPQILLFGHPCPALPDKIEIYFKLVIRCYALSRQGKEGWLTRRMRVRKDGFPYNGPPPNKSLRKDCLLNTRRARKPSHFSIYHPIGQVISCPYSEPSSCRFDSKSIQEHALVKGLCINKWIT